MNRSSDKENIAAEALLFYGEILFPLYCRFVFLEISIAAILIVARLRKPFETTTPRVYIYPKHLGIRCVVYSFSSWLSMQVLYGVYRVCLASIDAAPFYNAAFKDFERHTFVLFKYLLNIFSRSYWHFNIKKLYQEYFNIDLVLTFFKHF